MIEDERHRHTMGTNSSRLTTATVPTQYAFYFDASACSGCKACQLACKDRHGLPVGLLWRRVYEVTGGTWRRSGEAWVSSVFAYNVSLACNHCERPICVEVCPARAIKKRADGIVLIDPEKCIGCRYCSWACPYGAPQYDSESGRMTKCTLCAEDLDAGLPPSCVAACPLRVLDFGDRAQLEARYGSVEPIYPLPETELAEPALVITPHKDADRAAVQSARVANWEEVGGQ
jgi:anaerobic dimethyl sulfoxide reductase subunit B (iron-sulfur subunit)